MAKVINISDKLNNEKPVIVANDKEYIVNDGVGVITKFEELASESSAESLKKALEITLGKEAAKELKLDEMSIGNFKVWITAIIAAVQEMSYEEADARFRKSE